MSVMREFLRQALRWYRFLTVLAFLTLAIVYVPLIPYSSYCLGTRSVGAVVLAPAFRAEFIAYLSLFEVPYIRVGGLVLVHFWDWLDDPDDWLINASNKSLYLVVDPLFGANVDVTQLPKHVRDLIAESEREHGDIRPTCELVRAVAIEGW